MQMSCWSFITYYFICESNRTVAGLSVRKRLFVYCRNWPEWAEGFLHIQGKFKILILKLNCSIPSHQRIKQYFGYVGYSI